MQSNAFGPVATKLLDAEVAQLMIVAALAPAAFREFTLRGGSMAKLRSELRQRVDTGAAAGGAVARPLVVRVGHITKLLANCDSKAQTALRHGLPSLWSVAGEKSGAMHALELSGVPEKLDGTWLVRILAASEGVNSIVFRENKSRDGMWAWPLRICVADTRLGRPLAEKIAVGRYNFIYELVKGRSRTPVDLAIVPGSIDDALAERPRMAHAVLVLVEAVSAFPPDIIDRLKDLREHYSAGFAGICAVPREERPAWMQALIRELSHNKSLPASLFEIRSTASRRPEGGPVSKNLPIPMLIGDARFLRGHDLASAARRLAAALKSIDRLQGGGGRGPLAKEGNALARGIRNFSWMYESGDAFTVANLTRTAQKRVGRTQLDRMLIRTGMPAPNAPAPTRPPRRAAKKVAARVSYPRLSGAPGSGYGSRRPKAAPVSLPVVLPRDVDIQASQLRIVQMRVLDAASRAPPEAKVTKLQARAAYRLQVHIGPSRGLDFISAPESFDESKLPPSDDGHKLTIVYCPLSPVEDASGDLAIPAPTQVVIHLPRTGASEVAEFELRVGPVASEFLSRVIVTFANRVLQTLRLRIDGRGCLQLIKENFYTPNLEPHASTLPAQIAFVTDENPAGGPGLATLTMDTSSYIDSNSLAAEVATISVLLEEANHDAVGEEPSFDDPEALRRIRALAMHGSQLLYEVQRKHGDTTLARAVHIQMVEAVPDAFFPLEFLYDGTPPLPEATLCPHAREALRDQSFHATCPHTDSEDHVCPAQFWGLKKCIERLPSKAPPPASKAAPTSSVPARLGPFQRALLGASQRANVQMSGPNGLPSRVRRSVKSVEAASNWKDWKERVKQSPDLMILMPHTLNLPKTPNMAAMEISNTHLGSNSIRPPYVRGTQPPGPLVLLLGCSTVLTKVPFLNFVRYFNLAGAPVVVGTLAEIHVTQAAMIAERFLHFVSSCPAPRRFDEVLRDFKRQLLDEGHQGVLALVSYGQVSWEI